MRYNYAVSGSQVMDLTVGKTVNVAGSIDLTFTFSSHLEYLNARICIYYIDSTVMSFSDFYKIEYATITVTNSFNSLTTPISF
jgi:hypothetical protein